MQHINTKEILATRTMISSSPHQVPKPCETVNERGVFATTCWLVCSRDWPSATVLSGRVPLVKVVIAALAEMLVIVVEELAPSSLASSPVIVFPDAAEKDVNRASTNEDELKLCRNTRAS